MKLNRDLAWSSASASRQGASSAGIWRGVTEYWAVRAMIPRSALLGIELVNLKGQIAAEQDNAVLKLQDGLEQDLAMRRFSIISFDTDVAANMRAVRRQLEMGRVVGSIHANAPDFEFANFDLAELVEIAARIDEAEGVFGGLGSQSQLERR